MVSLRAARIEAGIKAQGVPYTQTDVADALGISRSTIGRWERGDLEVSMMARYALAYYYKMNVDDFDIKINKEG